MTIQAHAIEPQLEMQRELQPTTPSVRAASAVAGLGMRAMMAAPPGVLPGSSLWLLGLAGAALLGVAGCPAWGPPAPPRFRRMNAPQPEAQP